MTATTIKVDTDLRDRLKAQAADHGTTLGQHLAALADLDDRSRRFERLRDQIRRTPPDEWASYLDETAAWDGAVSDGLTS
ncbi:DNA mismatch repair protein MutS [Ruania rhizosphaerae]|uniref:ribbon-helix-helix protein n=1 Tax=Ruania rhizosphaerae TaxID=1840413 RepID=UPI001359DBBB|nr:DNA mismatch repair protein MutS [Ruania rhizosphaerae]